MLTNSASKGPSLYPAFTGGGWGAKAMIKDGALQNPRPDAIFGLHVTSFLRRLENELHAARQLIFDAREVPPRRPSRSQCVRRVRRRA